MKTEFLFYEKSFSKYKKMFSRLVCRAFYHFFDRTDHRYRNRKKYCVCQCGSSNRWRRNPSYVLHLNLMDPFLSCGDTTDSFPHTSVFDLLFHDEKFAPLDHRGHPLFYGVSLHHFAYIYNYGIRLSFRILWRKR